MKRTKLSRVFSMLLALCMVVALLPADDFFAAQAATSPLSFDLLADFKAYASANGIVAVEGTNMANAPKIKDYSLSTSYNWNAGLVVRNAANDWIWTQSAASYGLFFKSDLAANSYNSIAFDVKTTGIYKIDLNYVAWNGGGDTVAYIVPVSTMIPTPEQFTAAGSYLAKSPVMYHYNATAVERSTEIPYVELAQGTYNLIIYQTKACTSGATTPGYFFKGFTLTETTAISGVTVSGTPSEPLITGATVQLSATVLPAGVTQEVTWVSSNPHIVSVDANGKATAVGIGTATITAKSASPSKSASVTITARPNTTKYEYRESVNAVWGNATGGLNTADSKYIDTIGATLFNNANWKPGALVSDPTLGRWLWTSSARSLGIYFEAKAEAAYNSVDIYVPKAGWYKAVSHDSLWTGGGTVEVYLAPQTSNYNTLIETKVFKSNPINHYGTGEQENLLADYIHLNAGNYTVLYQQTEVGVNANPGYFIHGLHLERYPDVTGVDFAWDALTLSLGETRELISEVYPVGVLQDVEYSSADTSIAEVTDDGEIVAKKQGTTTITVTSVADGTKSKTIPVTVSAKSVYYDYRTKKAETSLDVDGWEINEEICAADAGFEWVETSGLSDTYGLFFGKVFQHPSTDVRDYVSVNVRVPVDGIYQVSTVYPIWQNGGVLDVYIVESQNAEDFLTVGTRLNLDGVETQNDPNDKSNVKFLETTHEIEVELDANTEYTIVYYASTLRQGYYIQGTRLTALDFGYEFVPYAPSSVSAEGQDVTAELLWSGQKSQVMTNGFLWKWTNSSAFNASTGGAGLYIGGEYGSIVDAGASYVGINLEIPAQGWYDISLNYMPFAGAGSFNLYMMTYEDSSKYIDYQNWATKLNNEPIDADSESVYGGIDQMMDNKYYFDKPGKYTLVFEFVEMKSGLYVRGVDFEPALYLDEITIDEEETVILEDKVESYDLSIRTRPAVAKNATINWTSSDTSVATVEDGTVTFLKDGHVVITAVAADGSGIEKKINFLRGYEISYNYNFRESLKSVYEMYGISYFPSLSTQTNAEQMAAQDAFVNDYTASVNAGSSPWMYVSTGNADEVSISYSHSTNDGFGVFVNYGYPGDYARLKIKVDKNGRYHMVFNHDRWKVSAGAFDLFLAPVNATDPCAERWMIHSFTPNTINEELRNEVYLGTRTIPEGEYYFTLKFKEPSSNRLIGFSSFKLLKYEELGKYTTEGAQIRLPGENAFGKDEPQGLRFISWVSKDLYNVDSSEVKEFGTVLIPTADLTNLDDLKIDAVLNGHRVAKVPAKNRYVDTNESVRFTAVVTNLPESQYEMSITARAYVILQDDTVIYGDTYTERSIYEVAKNGLEKHGNELSNAETEEFTRIKGIVEQ